MLIIIFIVCSIIIATVSMFKTKQVLESLDKSLAKLTNNQPQSKKLQLNETMFLIFIMVLYILGIIFF